MFRRITIEELRGVLATTLLLACLTQAAPVAKAQDSAEKLDPRQLCSQLTATAERIARLPRLLLHAVSLAESGRWDGEAQASFAWPWTVYAEGKGRYYPTREDAVAAVHALQAKGVKNIDVGCMQVNLMHHGEHFDSIEQALDPVYNVAYAAHFLKGLRLARRSWATAVAHYHSATRKHGRPYWRRVYALWNQERRRDFLARREARIEESRAERSARKHAYQASASR